MSYISSTAFKDSFRTYPDGCTVQVSVKSTIIGVENIRLGDDPAPNCNDQTNFKQLLKINDPENGILYLDETIASFQAKIKQVLTPASEKTSVLIITVGNGVGEVAPGTLTTQHDELIGATILRINYAKEEFVTFDGVSSQVPFDPLTGELSWSNATGAAGLYAATSPISVIYNTK